MSDATSSEFARIALLREIYASNAPHVALGIGDDCAALAESPGTRVWTIDAAVAGVHFDLRFMALEDVGFRALMAAASDIAAMGATPDGALSALVLPRDFSDDALIALVHGTAEAARQCGCPVVGGNLARGESLVITTSVLGTAPGRVVSRAGARPGDGVFVTGALGGAALGLRALSRGVNDPRFAACITRFLRPRARFDRAQLVAQVASAAIDVSDGLLQDLTHLAQASGVTLELHASALPRERDFAELCGALGTDPRELVLAGGEDYELAFTADRTRVAPEQAVCVGRVCAGPGHVRLLDDDGRELPAPPGFDHFR